MASDRSDELFLRDRWAELAGLHVLTEPAPQTRASLEELRETEWSVVFERAMRVRLIMGALRYGRLHERGKPAYERVASMIKRLQEYSKTRNRELLVDVANLALLEFEEGDNHLTPMDEREHVARRL